MEKLKIYKKVRSMCVCGLLREGTHRSTEIGQAGIKIFLGGICGLFVVHMYYGLCSPVSFL